MSIVSDRLRAARLNKALSQMDIMRLTKINNKTLSGYENAVSEPDYASLVLLSNIYGVTTDYLLGKVSTPTDYLVPKRPWTPADDAVETVGDPATDEINDLLSQMSPEEKDAFRRLAQSVVNRQTKGVG